MRLSKIKQPEPNGGGERNRTDDPLLARQVLSQLSYTPGPLRRLARPDYVVGLGRLELPTSRLSGVRSNHLSYRPIGEAGRAAHTSFTVASKNTRPKDQFLASKQRVGNFL